MAAVAPKLPGPPSRASQLDRERWMRERQAAKPLAPRLPPVRTHRRFAYCGTCRDCRELDAFLASGDQRRMPWPKPDQRGGPQSSWSGIVEYLQKFGAPLTTPGYTMLRRPGLRLGGPRTEGVSRI